MGRVFLLSPTGTCWVNHMVGHSKYLPTKFSNSINKIMNPNKELLLGYKVQVSTGPIVCNCLASSMVRDKIPIS